jgi:hypothetical protein
MGLFIGPMFYNRGGEVTENTTVTNLEIDEESAGPFDPNAMPEINYVPPKVSVSVAPFDRSRRAAPATTDETTDEERSTRTRTTEPGTSEPRSAEPASQRRPEQSTQSPRPQGPESADQPKPKPTKPEPEPKKPTSSATTDPSPSKPAPPANQNDDEPAQQRTEPSKPRPETGGSGTGSGGTLPPPTEP